MADVDRLNCKWCNSSEAVDNDCQHCRENRCRAPKWNDRQWTMKVTPNRLFAPITQSGIVVGTETACCQSLTDFVCSAFTASCSGFYESSGLLRYSEHALQVFSVVQQWNRGSAVFPPVCTCIERKDVCTMRFRYDRKCAQGYRFAADIQSIKLFVSRTFPRYTCTPVQCQYRLALVVEGRVALAFGTQVIDATAITRLSGDTGTCGSVLPSLCTPGTVGTYPVPTPPPFNASLLSLSPVTWRRVYRRTVDTLEFPMTFDAANDVGQPCGPQCADTITETVPTFATSPPALTCEGFPDVILCDFCYDTSGCAEVVECMTDCTNWDDLLWSGARVGRLNTEELRSSSGPTTVNTLPTFALPDSFAVEVY